MQREFTVSDQMRFAEFTGDRNPIHFDGLKSSQTVGAPVVHGMHILLWALNEAIVQEAVPFSIEAVRVQFRTPLLIGQRAILGFRKKTEGHLQITVSVKEAICSTIHVWSDPGRVGPQSVSRTETPRFQSLAAPVELTFEEMAQSHGRYQLEPAEPQDWPRCRARVGSLAVRGIGALSTLVGMVSPGLHALFGAAEIRFDGPETEWLDFRATEADARFQRILYDISGAGLSAGIEAFRRATPVERP